MININKILLEEKNRILELHKTATKNHYLMEQPTTPTVFRLDDTVTLENAVKGGSELKLFKGTTFNIGNKFILYANTNWQKVGDYAGSVEASSKGNVYYSCSKGKFSIGTEQKLPPCPITTKDTNGNTRTSFQKCKNLFYNESYPSLTTKIQKLCASSQTFVKGKTPENKIDKNKNVEDVKTPEVKTPKVKTPEVKTPEVKTPEVKTPEVKTPEVQTPENAKIISDVDTYDETALSQIAAEIQ